MCIWPMISAGYSSCESNLNCQILYTILQVLRFIMGIKLGGKRNRRLFHMYVIAYFAGEETETYPLSSNIKNSFNQCP